MPAQELLFRRSRLMNFVIGNLLADEQCEETVHPKRVGTVHQSNASQDARSVFAIPIHDILSAMQSDVGTRGPPERCVIAAVELVVNSQKIADVIPLVAIVAIVKLDQRRSRFAKAIQKRIRQRARFDADDLERSR